VLGIFTAFTTNVWLVVIRKEGSVIVPPVPITEDPTSVVFDTFRKVYITLL
jgi:hypothetical protein